MRLGIGLPNTVTGTTGPLVVDWARRAEDRGFSGLATIDRLVFPSYDSLTSLAVVAGATARIELVTNILIAPAYPDVLLAKQAMTLAQLSGGRLTLGMGVGWRSDDFEATGRTYGDRGRRFEDLLGMLPHAFAGETVVGDRPLGPDPRGRGEVPLLVGGHHEQAFARAARFGDGWTAGGIPPDAVAPMVEGVHAAWKAAGRTDSPRIAALTYFSLGDTTEASKAYLYDYYLSGGEETATMVAESALRSPEAIQEAVKAYEAAGVTELYLDPTVPSLDQVDRLADVVL